jgi:excisionase family DNA binding protein
MLESRSGQSNGRTTVTLVGSLQDQVQFLREQLEREREGGAELRRIIAAMAQPIPELEQPTDTFSESRESPVPPSEEESSALQLLSIDEVVKALGMGRSWVYRRIKSGEIPSFRVGRNIKVKLEDLEGYLAGQRHQPTFEPALAEV